MRLLVQSAIIFFGTLMAAGLVALGEPTTLHVAPTPAARLAGRTQAPETSLQRRADIRWAVQMAAMQGPH